MKMKRIKTLIILTTLAIIDISCTNSKKSLTQEKIEKLFTLCADDTLYCKGVLSNFMQPKSLFDDGPITYFGDRFATYTTAASILGMKYDKNMSSLSQFNELEDEVRKKVHNLYLENRTGRESNIAIPKTFRPKTKLSNSIRNISLKDLIVRNNPEEIANHLEYNILYNKSNKSKNEERRFNELKEEIYGSTLESFLKMSYQEVDRDYFEYFFESKNLAKIFYISDPKKFREFNYSYFSNIIEEEADRLYQILKANEKEREINARALWEEYLN